MKQLIEKGLLDGLPTIKHPDMHGEIIFDETHCDDFENEVVIGGCYIGDKKVGEQLNGQVDDGHPSMSYLNEDKVFIIPMTLDYDDFNTFTDMLKKTILIYDVHYDRSQYKFDEIFIREEE